MDLELAGTSIDRTRDEVSDLIACGLLDIRYSRSRGKRAHDRRLDLDVELEDGTLAMWFLACPGIAKVVCICPAGRDGPPGLHRTTREEHERLLALGFFERESRDHYCRLIVVTGAKTASDVAESTLDLLERTFGWTPRGRLTMKTTDA